MPTLLEVQDTLQSPLVVKNTFLDVEDTTPDVSSSRKRWATCPESPCDWGETATSFPDGSPMTELHSSLSSEAPETLTLSSVRMRNASLSLSESDTVLEDPPTEVRCEVGNETLDHWPEYEQKDTKDIRSDQESPPDEAPATPRQARPGRRSSMMQTQDQWPEYAQRPSVKSATATAPTVAATATTAPTTAAATAPPGPALNLCQAISNIPLLHPAIPSVPPVVPDMYGGYMPMPGFAAPLPPMPGMPPLVAAPWAYPMAMQQQVALNAAMTQMTMWPQMWDARSLNAFPAMSAPVAARVEAPEVGMTPSGEDETPDVDTQRKRNGTRRLRLWAHIYLHMQLEGFDLVPRLIGRKGCNMRRIAECTGAKVRIRGQGSGHLEVDGSKEAPTPLMVAVTTDHQDPQMFRLAVEMLLKELRTVEGRFQSFCRRKQVEHEGPCYSVGVLQKNAEEALGDLLTSIPQTSGTPTLGDM